MPVTCDAVLSMFSDDEQDYVKKPISSTTETGKYQSYLLYVFSTVFMLENTTITCNKKSLGPFGQIKQSAINYTCIAIAEHGVSCAILLHSRRINQHEP